MKLPDPRQVVVTGPTDPIRYHYQPVINYFMKRRLAMALEILGGRRFHRLLDAGFGGGVFLPELADRADELYGIDIHDRVEDVQRMAEGEGIAVQLRRASVTATGYPDRFFDAVVCISVLEFIEDVDAAIRELARVTASGGVAVFGFPGENLLTSIGYRVARTPDPRVVHKADFRQILDATRKHFRLERLVGFPRAFPHWLTLFFVCESRKP
jgi:ubiquinone/menaquinone biosynthesis C-methylase UbiE